MSQDKITPFMDACAGSLGALFANTLVFPLDVAKTRLQVQNSTLASYNDPQTTYKSAIDALGKILVNEGITGLYAGLGPGLFGTVASSFSYFYFYSLVRKSYSRHNPGEMSIVTELGLGAVAGALSQLCTLPIAVVTTRQQTSHSKERQGFLQTVQMIVEEEGLAGLWKGLKASLVLCSNPAITYGAFEKLKATWLHGRDPSQRLTSLEIFVIGAISKTLATIVTYPYIMAKVRLQWKPSKDVHDQLSESERQAVSYRGSLDVLRKVLKSDGILGWYKGMNAQIVKAVLCQAILFVSKEHFTKQIIMIFALFSRLASAKTA